MGVLQKNENSQKSIYIGDAFLVKLQAVNFAKFV